VIEVRLPSFVLRALLSGLEAPRRVKQVGIFFADLLLMTLSFMLAANWVKGWFPPYPVGLWVTLGATVAGGSLGLWLSGIYQSYLRYWGGSTLARALLGGVTAGISGYVLSRWLFPGVLGVGFFLLDAVLIVLATAAARAVLSGLLRVSVESSAEPVVVYGAGSAGQQVLSIIRASQEYRPVCFVDDDRRLWGQSINGMRVESPSALPSWSPGVGFRRIILAIPSAHPQKRREIVARLAGLGVHVVSIPPLDEVLTGRRRIDQFLELDVNDLLVRDAVAPVPELFKRCVDGKAVLVSGAGGSIGSEICRQCVAGGVLRLVLFEISEPALYQIERELRATPEVSSGQATVVALLGDVRDRRAIDKAIAAFEVQTIYHAAAYKHVPLVETNIVAGVLNNIFGTRSVVEAAISGGVKDLVLISTDKAVNPTNVMGATKRCAELVVQAYAAESSTTRLSMVRFGNVLASSGSVVPLFREQVRKGGPVTVTHPDVTRYFMTIPEAAQLVVQASGIAQGGEVFLLDMGKPVRIRDLAVQVIELLGKSVRDDKNPDGDIEIQYTDLRPGEKLYEELLIDAEAQSTAHPKIRRAVERHVSLAELEQRLDELESACMIGDTDRCRWLLRELVPQYTPSSRNFDWMAAIRDDADV
jgi:FlaA1/EpsC-like NDP-sugar epimerase